MWILHTYTRIYVRYTHVNMYRYTHVNMYRPVYACMYTFDTHTCNYYIYTHMYTIHIYTRIYIGYIHVNMYRPVRASEQRAAAKPPKMVPCVTICSVRMTCLNVQCECVKSLPSLPRFVPSVTIWSEGERERECVCVWESVWHISIYSVSVSFHSVSVSCRSLPPEVCP